jgi:hypothetical protein
MYSELSDDEKQMYLDVLREAPLLPFSNFVSRGDKIREFDSISLDT